MTTESILKEMEIMGGNMRKESTPNDKRRMTSEIHEVENTLGYHPKEVKPDYPTTPKIRG